MRGLRQVLACLSITLLPGHAAAHDIWLAADRYRVAAGESLVVRELQGDRLLPERELALDPKLTTRFVLVTRRGETDLLGGGREIGSAATRLPVLRRSLHVAGAAVVAMEHDFILDHHASSTFLEYLEHEELPRPGDPAVLERDVHRELYARAMKCLVGAGDVGDAAVHTRPLGQTIEIVPLRSPADLEPGDRLRVSVLLRGKPVAGQLVKAMHRTAAGELTVTRGHTDSAGQASLSLDRAGVWLLRLVHLRPCTETDGTPCPLADWESYWASLSFSLD